MMMCDSIQCNDENAEIENQAAELMEAVKQKLTPLCRQQVIQHAKISPELISPECQVEYQNKLQEQISETIQAIMQEL